MSIIDHFDKAPEGGFSREWDAAAARRQFNVSLALIAALAFAVGLLAYSMRVGPQPTRDVVSATQTSPASPAFGGLSKL